MPPHGLTTARLDSRFCRAARQLTTDRQTLARGIHSQIVSLSLTNKHECCLLSRLTFCGASASHAMQRTIRSKPCWHRRCQLAHESRAPRLGHPRTCVRPAITCLRCPRSLARSHRRTRACARAQTCNSQNSLQNTSHNVLQAIARWGLGTGDLARRGIS